MTRDALQIRDSESTSPEVESLAAWLRNHYGLALGASAKANLSVALAKAAAARKVKPSRCLELAELGDEELRQVFISAVTVHETYFFRHPEHFELLREIAQHRLRRHPRAPLRVLSAGCASGEEPYSIAAALDSIAAVAPGSPKIEVLGIDIDRQSLDKARSANYGRWSVRGAIPPWATDAFVRSGDSWKVSDRIRAKVRFYEMNLNDSFLPLLLAKDSPFDFIFSRNVLMYLVPKAGRRVAEQLAHLAAPSGYLTFSPLDLERIPKILHSHPRDPTFVSRADTAGAAPAAAKLSRARLSYRPSFPADPAAHTERRPPPRTTLSGGNAQLGKMLAEAKRLTDSGELTRAKVVCEELLRQWPDAPAALFLAGLVELESERCDEAERFLHGALDREPDFALAHFALAMMLRRQGRASESRARLLRLSHLLAGLPSEMVLTGPEEITCGWLRSLVSHQLEA